MCCHFLSLCPQVVTFYNQLHEVDDKTSCKDFELLVTIEESSGKRLIILQFIIYHFLF